MKGQGEKKGAPSSEDIDSPFSFDEAPGNDYYIYKLQRWIPNRKGGENILFDLPDIIIFLI